MNKSQQPDKQLIHVFVASYPFDTLSDFVPQSRLDEINSCQNGDIAQSKYYVFKLLEIALNQTYGVSLDECNLARNTNGKWTCDACQLSMSHCGNVVAVAVSDLPVGVDVELIDAARFNGKLQARILTNAEQTTANSMTENERRLYANRLWTIKEAAFKRDNGQRFIASKYDTTLLDYATVTATVDEKPFFVTTVGEKSPQVKYCAIKVQISGK